MSGLLFQNDWGEDNSPIDDTEITTTILYYSTDQLKEFRQLAKIGIKQMFKEDFQQRGNLPIFLLNLLKQTYGDIKTEKTPDTQTSGEAGSDVPW